MRNVECPACLGVGSISDGHLTAGCATCLGDVTVTERYADAVTNDP